MDKAPEDIIKSILGNPEAVAKISGLLETFGKDAKGEKTEERESPLPFGLDNPEILTKLGRTWSMIANDNDPRINLIYALKPYLNPKRTESAEKAVRILKLSKMSPLFRELNIL